jgi:hypothetical protein
MAQRHLLECYTGQRAMVPVAGISVQTKPRRWYAHSCQFALSGIERLPKPYQSSPARLEVVALDHNPVRRLLSPHVFEARHRLARRLGEPESQRRRTVLRWDG